MSPHETDRRHLERQIVYARPIIVLLSILALLQQPDLQAAKRTISFLVAYLIVALAVIPLERFLRKRSWHLPIALDILALGFFMSVSPFSVPVWFPYLFVCWVAGMRWGLRAAIPLAGALALALVLLTAVKGEIGWMRVIAWVGLVGGTFAGGAALAFLADRSRHFASQNDFFSRITATLQVDQGLAESLRLLLDELARAFHVEVALLAYRDTDLERIYLWRLRAGESERLVPESYSLARADGFLLDDMDATVCWNSLEGAGNGFGWDRRDGRRLATLPRLPGPTQQELHMRSMLTVAFDQLGQPAGRLFLINGRKPFERPDLAWLERISRHIGPSLENVFLLRHLRARAIEGERSRISRDLHDGILQTLLSIEIQLDVLRRKVASSPDQAEASLGNLQQTVKNESAELRRMVTDLRPLRVQSADLVDLMHWFRRAFPQRIHARAGRHDRIRRPTRSRPRLSRAFPDLP